MIDEEEFAAAVAAAAAAAAAAAGKKEEAPSSPQFGFWSEAARNAVYTMNRTAVAPNSISPYEAVFGFPAASVKHTVAPNSKSCL